jgi:hypothetical protein
MKKVIILVILFAVVALISSCKKNEELRPKKNGFNAEEILKNLQKENYASLEKIVLSLYAKGNTNGLKSTSAEAKIGFSVPANSYIPGPGSFHRLIFVWSLVEYNNLLDKGIIVVTYNNQNQMHGDPIFFIGWDNEYCVAVDFTSNVTPLMIKMSFSYPSSIGMFSFEQYAHSWNNNYLFKLPQLDFNFAWEVSSSIAFGGTMKFNPANITIVYMQVAGNFNINTKDYVSFPPPNVFNSKMTMMVFDGNQNMGDLAVFVFPAGAILPPEILMPITFTPQRVDYFISTLENGRWIQGPITSKNLYLFNPGGNPNMKIWKFLP